MAGLVPVQLLLGQTDRIAVILSRLAAYQTGFHIELTLLARDDESSRILTSTVHGVTTKEAIERGFRFGLLMPDGVKLPADHSRPGFPFTPDQLRDLADTPQPPAPMVLSQGGGGGGRRWNSRYWIAPLPDDGTIHFVVRWDEAGLPETSTPFESKAILDAARTATAVWS